MNSRTTRRFREHFALLPTRIQRQARAAYRLFQNDPAHPGLRFKQVLTDPRIHSARVGLNYRALGVRRGDNITWFWIGPHAGYDELLKHL
jgi:hypothetical protein